MNAKIIPINTRQEPVIYLDCLPKLDVKTLLKIRNNNPNVLPYQMFYHTKPPQIRRILNIQSNPDGITREKNGFDAEIRGPPVFTGIFGDFEKKCFTGFFGILPDIHPKCFTNVLPID